MIILTVDFKYNLYFNLSMIPTPCFFHINPNHLNVLAGQGEKFGWERGLSTSISEFLHKCGLDSRFIPQLP